MWKSFAMHPLAKQAGALGRIEDCRSLLIAAVCHIGLLHHIHTRERGHFNSKPRLSHCTASHTCSLYVLKSLHSISCLVATSWHMPLFMIMPHVILFKPKCKPLKLKLKIFKILLNDGHFKGSKQMHVGRRQR